MVRPLALIALCSTVLACSREPGGDPLRVIPADVRAAALAPSLAALQAKAAGFLAGIEGTSGALDLLADRFGLDLRTPDGPEALGLDVEKGIAVFARGDMLAVAASVDEPEKFAEGVRARLEKGAGARAQGDTPEGGALLLEADTWRAASGVTADRVGIVVIGPPASDPVGAWNALAQGRGDFMRSEKAAAAKTAIGDGAVVYLVLDQLLPNAPAGLGLARGVVQSMRDALPTFAGGMTISEDALAVKLSAAHVGDGFLPVSWVTATGTPEALARVFPKTTTAFIRFRFALDKVRSLPGFLRDTFLPERLPGLEALPLPTVSDLIDLIEGDVAVGLLGLDADANLGQLAFIPAHPERAIVLLHSALCARVRNAAAVKSAFAGIASQLETSQWAVAPIRSHGDAKGGYEGWSFAKEHTRYAVLIDDDVVVFIIGAGEVEPFIAVKEGRALSLASFAEGGSVTVKQALGQEDATPFGLTLGPLRLLRELSARGLPPYFLKIINDMRLIAATVGASEKRLDLSLEIGL